MLATSKTPDHVRDAARNPAWMARAACAGVDSGTFFPEPRSPRRERAAKSWCARCPVTSACLAWAVARQIEHGVWGGTSEQERKPLIRAIRLALEAAARP
jgi:WhiB family transcriptional regulator, redox-sensing transcriptional regulator